MGRVIDALIAYRLLKLLVTPFKKTKAYQMGIIDDKGKVLIKAKQFKDKIPANKTIGIATFGFFKFGIRSFYYYFIS